MQLDNSTHPCSTADLPITTVSRHSNGTRIEEIITMRDLAPDITRQRLLIEGCYTATVDRHAVQRYLLELAAHLDLQTYGEPVIHSPEGVGKAENAGFDAFLPLIDSGISLYVWNTRAFFAVVLFTCKRFSVEQALQFTRRFFAATEIEYASF